MSNTYEVTFESTTYRTYTVKAVDSATAEEMAQEVLQDDFDVSSAWKENAQIETVLGSL
jgi:NADPH-dependent ferric siderophore reductase